MATSIQYVKGDATAPIGSGPKILVHIVSDKGGWGKGFVRAISRRWKDPERHYRTWHRGHGPPFVQGDVQLVPVEDDPPLWVANMLAQVGQYPKDGIPPIRYEYVRAGLAKIREFAQSRSASVHMPRIGAGLAGGKWPLIEEIITDELTLHDVPVTVYDFVRP